MPMPAVALCTSRLRHPVAVRAASQAAQEAEPKSVIAALGCLVVLQLPSRQLDLAEACGSGMERWPKKGPYAEAMYLAPAQLRLQRAEAGKAKLILTGAADQLR